MIDSTAALPTASSMENTAGTRRRRADLLDLPVARPSLHETTALGAAYLAGLRVGYWKSLDDVEQNWRRKREFTPEMARETRNRLVQRWDKAVNVVRSFS